MSSVNKHSLREEVDTLKAQFERLCTEGKMGSESRALFQAMLTLFNLLMAVFMERRTTKDSKNSSKPSSQTAKDDTAVFEQLFSLRPDSFANQVLKLFGAKPQ